jgi:hypothetical protein
MLGSVQTESEVRADYIGLSEHLKGPLWAWRGFEALARLLTAKLDASATRLQRRPNSRMRFCAGEYAQVLGDRLTG